MNKILRLIYTALLIASCSTSHNAKMVEEQELGEKPAGNIGATATMIENDIADKSKMREKISQSGKFAFSLFEHICSNNSQENICISPSSAYSALAMIANGAEENTLKQMLSVLCVEGLEELNSIKIDSAKHRDNTATLITANSIWINDKLPVKEKFIEVNRKFHDAQIYNMPFNNSTLSEINAWCDRNTNGKIKSILDKLDDSTKMLLLNALYFKGEWNKQFSESNTEEAPFTKSDGSITTVMMMNQTLNTGYSMDNNMQLVSLPFKNCNIEMQFILPRRGMDIQEAAGYLAENYDTLNSNINYSKKIALSLPRFKVEYKKSLKEALSGMGMSDAFNKEANFKGISKVPLYIEDVFQKSYLKIDENGAEAAAVTSIMVGLLSARPSQPIEVRFDRPFIYIIRDKGTEDILFIGYTDMPKE